MMHKRLLYIYLPALLLFAFVGGVAAQLPGGNSDSGTCPTTVNGALQSLDELCTGLERNQACYGVNRVVTTFFDEVQEETFNAPGAITPIEIIETIRTAPLNPETQEWGVAVMSVQANLPNTLPGQGALFVLIGDVSIENHVDPAAATSLPDPSPATLVADQEKINLRSGPGTTFSVIVAANVGDPVGVDAVDETGQWYRVVYNDFPMWVASFLVTFDDPAFDTSTLPILDDSRFAPMQSFVLQTGIGAPECAEAPNSLLVQSPQDVEITLSVNGADVTIGSTVTLDTPDQKLRITTLDGTATVRDRNPETGEERTVVINKGFTAVADLGDDGRVRDIDDFTEPAILYDEELTFFEDLDEIDGEVLRYDFDVPDFADDFFEEGEFLEERLERDLELYLDDYFFDEFGEELPTEERDFFIDAYMDGDLTDEELEAFLGPDFFEDEAFDLREFEEELDEQFADNPFFEPEPELRNYDDVGVDLDGDGFVDDYDGDGLPDPDLDGDGFADFDADGDGIPDDPFDFIDPEDDLDPEDFPDDFFEDADGDGLVDGDFDGDGFPDDFDPDDYDPEDFEDDDFPDDFDDEDFPEDEFHDDFDDGGRDDFDDGGDDFDDGGDCCDEPDDGGGDDGGGDDDGGDDGF
ncbi:MAG: hypothetical protein AAFU54_23570 [Chloroflexota bacterium]